MSDTIWHINQITKSKILFSNLECECTFKLSKALSRPYFETLRSLKELDALKPCRVLDPYFEFEVRGRSRRWIVMRPKFSTTFLTRSASCQLFSIAHWILLGFFLVVCLFFSSSPGMPFQMASHCRGWGQASPAKRSTWTWWKQQTNKQTDKFLHLWKPMILSIKSENQVTHIVKGVWHHHWSNACQWPNFGRNYFVTLSVNRQHLHVVRKAAFLHPTASPKP